MAPETSNGIAHSSSPQNGDASSDGLKTGKIKVLIADGQPIVREGITALFARQSDIEAIGEAKSASSSGEVREEVSPNVVLWDFTISFSISDVIRNYPSAKIVAFTDGQSEEQIYQAVQSGVRGYLPKSATLDEILGCIRAVAEGRSWIPTRIAELLAKRMAAPELTRREKDVLSAVAQGKSNKEIGTMLGLSEGTVKVHISHILGKLKVNGRTEALATAAARGLVSLTARYAPATPSVQ